MTQIHGNDEEDGSPRLVTTEVTSVTVYSDRARVSRGGAVRVAPGRQRIAIGPLPVALIDGSVAARVGVSPAVRLLSIEVDRAFGREVSHGDAAALIERRDGLRREIAGLDEESAGLSGEQDYLETLPVSPILDENDNPRPIALETGAWSGVLAFVGDRLADLRSRVRTAERRRERLGEQLSDTEVELRSLGAYESDERKRIVLEVQATAAGEAAVVVDYTLAGPRWRPSYDLQVDAAAGRLELHRYAMVRQATGEDWARAALRLSTAAPQVGAELPRLLAWRLGDESQHRHAAAVSEVGEMDAGEATMVSAVAPPAPSRPMAIAGMAMEAVSARRRSAPPRQKRRSAKTMDREEACCDEPMEPEALADAFMDDEMELDIFDEAPAPPPPPSQPPIRPMGKGTWALPAGAELSFRPHEGAFRGAGRALLCPTPRHAAGGFDFAHEAEGPQTVPSDGREHRVPLGIEERDCALVYEVVAPLEQRAYLRAAITNRGERPLLAGESFVFLDGGFVARAFVETVAPGDDLELVLGVDEDLEIERNVEQTTATTGLLTKKDRTLYQVAVKIRSFKNREVRLRIRDQVPITWQDDDIEIETLEVHPRPDEKADRGMMAWTLDLPPGETATLDLQYAVERPRDYELITERGTP